MKAQEQVMIICFRLITQFTQKNVINGNLQKQIHKNLKALNFQYQNYTQGNLTWL